MIRVVHPGSGSWFFTHPVSRIQGPKRHRIPDPDPFYNRTYKKKFMIDNFLLNKGYLFRLLMLRYHSICYPMSSLNRIAYVGTGNLRHSFAFCLLPVAIVSCFLVLILVVVHSRRYGNGNSDGNKAINWISVNILTFSNKGTCSNEYGAETLLMAHSWILIRIRNFAIE